MRRILLKLATFVLAFGLGVGVSIGWRLYQWSLVPFEVSSDFSIVVLAAPPGIRMVNSVRTCGLNLTTDPPAMKLSLYGETLCVISAPPGALD